MAHMITNAANWLFHTGTGVIVLLVGLLVVCLVLAAVMEKGTRRRYSDRGNGTGRAGLRAKADALVDSTDAAIDAHLSDDGGENDGKLVGALEDLWNSWDLDADDSDGK